MKRLASKEQLAKIGVRLRILGYDVSTDDTANEQTRALMSQFLGRPFRSYREGIDITAAEATLILNTLYMEYQPEAD